MVSKFDAAQQEIMRASYYAGYSKGESVLPHLQEIQKENDAIKRITFLGKILNENDLAPVFLNLTSTKQVLSFVKGLSENKKMTGLRRLIFKVDCILIWNPSMSAEQKSLINFALECL